MASINVIAAVGPGRELGSDGDLIWHISADLRNFKALTMRHPVIMGRKTWESLPRRPLPGRLNIVLTRSDFNEEGAVAARSPQEAIAACGDEDSVFVIGGEQIYSVFLPMADTLYITYVDSTPNKVADAWFPDYRSHWALAEASPWATDPDGVTYRFEKWLRK